MAEQEEVLDIEGQDDIALVKRMQVVATRLLARSRKLPLVRKILSMNC